MRNYENTNGPILRAAVRRCALRGSAVIALILLMLGRPAGAVQNYKMRIAVAEGVSSGRLIGLGISLSDAKGVRVSVQNGASVAASGAGVKVGGQALALPVGVTAKSGLGWDGTRYRGVLSLIPAGKGFTVVDEVDLESYIRGILKVEMSPEWNIEALKAQAILARTYAVKNRGRFGSRGYDLDATDNSQVYRGVNAEDPRTDMAVAETGGMILSWNGAPADIYYHSDSGGFTADMAHVWGGGRPYLVAKQEIVGYASPNSTWQLSLTGEQIASILGRMGRPVGRVRSVEVSLKDAAGRAVQLRITGDGGTADVRAHDFRMAAGSKVVRSTFFTVSGGTSSEESTSGRNPAPPAASGTPASLTEMASGVDPLVEMTKLGVFSRDELYDMLFKTDDRDGYLRLGERRLRDRGMSLPGVSGSSPAPPVEKPPRPAADASASDAFVFKGRGWGHGVGLSQWGAKAMADSGMKCEEILGFYFPGTRIVR
ncbi:MAG: SpoIID/LytB domain-containing protein [Synergistaceae bacterium]|jgi:stage II sporulation protein D|nr:SpoIID/LytB domain-containing protein [Synergistaceae bacterium]